MPIRSGVAIGGPLLGDAGYWRGPRPTRASSSASVTLPAARSSVRRQPSDRRQPSRDVQATGRGSSVRAIAGALPGLARRGYVIDEDGDMAQAGDEGSVD